MELLKLGALLIEFMHKELLDHRKELIKFAWNNIKARENERHAVNLARFGCTKQHSPRRQAVGP